MLYVRSFDEPTIHKLTQTPRQRRVTGGTPEQQGFAVYSQFCFACHGPDRARITFPERIDAAVFKTTVRNGKGEMPPFSDRVLASQNLETLMAYLKNPAAASVKNSPQSASPAAAPSFDSARPSQTRYYGQFGNSLLTKDGLVAISPPWSQLVAYDLNEGTIKWRIPVGSTPGLVAKGITNTGSSRHIRNGPVVTAGGLIFLASGPDRTVHAYDKNTGEILWAKELDGNPDGIPAVYEAGGREYVVFFAAEGSRPESMTFSPGKSGSQGYYVFALPGRSPASTR
jgi:quinoprotein glucose dehydrogenase